MIKLPIFVYHHVSESLHHSSKNMQVSPDEFEQQMYFLSQKGFRCLSLSEVITNWQKGKPQPERSFVLTFDDGYIDYYDNALPILEKFGFTATIFVVVKPIEEGNKRFLSWQEIRELAQKHFTFGSHTLTYPRLRSLDNRTIKLELNELKNILEERLGKLVELLAYPYGELNERIQDMACKSGYLAACGVTVGNLSQFNLWRVPVKEHESEPTFFWKAYGWYYPYTWLLTQTSLGRKMREIKQYIREKASLSILR